MINAAVLPVLVTVVEPHLTLEIWNEKLEGLEIAVIGDIHAGKGPHERRRT